MSTVATLKDGSGFQPLLLVYFAFQGTSTKLLLSTIPLDGVSNAVFPGIGTLPAGSYLGRIAEEDISSFQLRSPQGVDRPSKFTVHIFDADHFIWTNYAQTFGFRGASMVVCLVMWKPGTSTFSTDAPQMFIGSCDMEVPAEGFNVLSVSANNSHNLATVKLPQLPIQNRCPKRMPTTAAERALALSDQTSPFYRCGYSADQSGGFGNIATTGGPLNDGKNIVDSFGTIITDANGVFVSCDFTRSNVNYDYVGCMARMGNPATTTVAPDGDLMHDKSGRLTGTFGANEWNPGIFYAIAKNYTSGGKVPVFSFLNSTILGEYCHMLFGRQWVNAQVLNVVESGNDTKFEVAICSDDIGIQTPQVQVNGILVGKDPTGDPNQYWLFVGDGTGYLATGGRHGVAVRNITGYNDLGSNHNSLGDPFGSIARIMVCVYKDIFTGFGVPQVKVQAVGPTFLQYMPILTAVGNGTTVTLTFANNLPNADCIIPFTGVQKVDIYGCTLLGADGVNWQISAATQGPPGTITIPAAISGSGTGGFVRYRSAVSFDQIAGSPPQSNPAWAVLEILRVSNYNIESECDLSTFAIESRFAYTPILYQNAVGDTASHARYICEFVLESRRSAAEVLAAVLRSFNAYTSWGQNGLLQLFIMKTLADSQPLPVTGSNYATPIASFAAAGNPILSAGINSSVTTIPLNVALVCAANQPIQIGSEQMQVTGGMGTTSLTVTRAFGGTTAASHSINAVVFPCGYAAYSFDETNILRSGTQDNIVFGIKGEESPTSQTPNNISISFQDSENGYVQDSLSEYSNDGINRAGGALQPGGSVVQEAMSVLGISNFDQGTRIANVDMAELQNGNEFGDARGTRTFTIETTVRCESLRNGHLVIFSWQALGITKQLFRVKAIYPSRNFERCKLTISWHSDVWYQDQYGQTPDAFNNQSNKFLPNRPPLVWQPGELSGTNSAIYGASEYVFDLTEVDIVQADGSIIVELQASGFLPINQISSSIKSPIVPIQATSSSTGGFIAGGKTYYVQLVASDGVGAFSAPSAFITCVVPAGTNTNTITIDNISFDDATSSVRCYVGTDHHNITIQQSFGAPGSTLTLTVVNHFLLTAPPDLVASTALVQAKVAQHVGSIGAIVVGVTSTTITLGAPPTGSMSTSLFGYYIMIIGSSGAATPFVDFLISGNTVGGSNETIITVSFGDPTLTVHVGDSAVICLQANIFSATTIGDALLPNAYNGGLGLTAADIGRTIRIIAGTGRYQRRLIQSVTTTTATLSSAWNTIPDATSLFIVEDSRWSYSNEISAFANSAFALSSSFVVDFQNTAAAAMLVQVLIGDASGNYSIEARSPFRIGYVYGTPGSSAGLQDGYETPAIVAGHVTIDVGVKLNKRVVINASLVTVDPPITSNTPILSGAAFYMYLDVDATGGVLRIPPTFSTAAGGFMSDVTARVAATFSQTASTRTYLQFTFHGSKWGMDLPPNTNQAIT